ncbi:hypothetical protein Mal15_55110 [Stieleria maiorica]|uniref:DUF4405 domain-containing protein n=1 Tax=Stieleria maiorica TaxID=2795974 RepID=A0A5B9MP12_9BACT|nr:hypothetical protein [Stieleria maiorica]QEG01435.1 hypothetical protein Mal15_55110 [Stieleria maiorica]
MRHVINIGLLCAFATLLSTGVMAFALPFSIATTRVHVFSGLVVSVLVACHLGSRVAYFKNVLAARIRGLSYPTLAVVVALSAGLAWASLWGWQPISWLMNQSYEARHREIIFRSSSLVGFGRPSPHSRVIVRTTKDAGGPELAVLLNFRETVSGVPSVAVWAESTTGTMIETLFLEDRLAYSEKPDWLGGARGRNEILPIWRHKYTAVTGVDPNGEVDAVSGATENHTFALDEHLEYGKGNRFVLCVEINAPADPNGDWTDSQLGQPSLLYTALVDVDRDSPHALLELTGHGGGATEDGNVQYDLESITTAKGMADLFLVKLDREPDVR